MFSRLLIPLAAFAAVVLIVAIVKLAKIQDREMEVQQRLYLGAMQHQRKMLELEQELQRLKGGA